MGIYLRKSIKVGPLRFNLSKSGVGLSAGAKGLRFGIGPRGNYVHMGRGGLYYRATLPSSPPHPKQPAAPNLPGHQAAPSNTHAPLEEIESADVSQIVDSSSRALLDELNHKRAKMRMWPIIAVLGAATMMFGIAGNWPTWLLALLFLAGASGTYVAYARDVQKKTVVLFYDFDSDLEVAYSQLHGAAGNLGDSAGVWHIEASGKVHDRKYHAGATSLVRRKPTFIKKKEPPYVKTNIETVAVGVGRQTLHFFPDRVLIYDTNGVGAVSYRDLRINIDTTLFIENSTVPRDAQVVDRTWKYVNKSGGPDHRFKDNKQLPVCRYEEISLSSQSGLHEVIQLSRCGLGEAFAKAISLLGEKIPEEDMTTASAAP